MPDHPFIARLSARLDDLVRVPASGGADPPAARTGLLVALSGGPDSVALLCGARAWAARRGVPLEAAHLNHRLRGPDADADEAFCRDLCARLGVPLHVGRADPRPLARRRGGGVEEAGRRLRRRFLAKVLARRPHLGLAATGHHRDDQAETVIMRMFRGAGLDGLRGIRPMAGRVIHPLLETPRSELLSFLEATGEPWREDATNDAGDAVRSRLRRELLPLARDIFGVGAAAAPARAASLLDDDAALLDRQARRALAAATAPDDPDALLAPALLALPRPLARRALRRHLARRHGVRRDLGRAHVDAVLAWLAGGVSGHALDLPGGWRAVREFDRLAFAPPDRPNLPAADAVAVRVVAAGEPLPAAAPDERIWTLELPAARLRGAPRARPWRPGDRLRPPGLGGHKKVSDLLRERRVPVRLRPGVLVVEDDDGPLWVVGLARDERSLGLPGEAPALTLVVCAPGLPSDRA